MWRVNTNEEEDKEGKRKREHDMECTYNTTRNVTESRRVVIGVSIVVYLCSVCA